MERRSKERVINLEVYTDGSLKRKGKNMLFGGWAFVVVQDSKEIYHQSGNEFNTTNQRMELTAVQKALEYIQSIRRKSEKVVIYSDSAYIINCYKQEWYVKWEHNHWMNKANEPVANQDLWVPILPFFDNFWYNFKKVAGHTGNYWNEYCDTLAQNAAKVCQNNFRGLKHMDEKNFDIYEVEANDYKSFIEQIKPECRIIKEVKLDWKTSQIQIVSKKTGHILAGRTFDHRTGNKERDPERYYIYETPLAEESRPPVPKYHLHLDTREEVQAFFTALSKMKGDNK